MRAKGRWESKKEGKVSYSEEKVIMVGKDKENDKGRRITERIRKVR